MDTAISTLAHRTVTVWANDRSVHVVLAQIADHRSHGRDGLASSGRERDKPASRTTISVVLDRHYQTTCRFRQGWRSAQSVDARGGEGPILMAEKLKRKPIKGKPATLGANQSSNGSARSANLVAPRLIGITPTGPIYRTQAVLTLLSTPVFMAYVQELALRSMKPEARVVSTAARRLRGDDALAAWAKTCAGLGPQLGNTSARFRRQFLAETLTYVRRQGNVNGIEPALGAAINAAWPLLDLATTQRVLQTFKRYVGQSSFAEKYILPIADPTSRTVTVFVPGELAALDVEDWMDRRAINYGSGAPAGGSGGRGGSTRDRLGMGADPWQGRGDPRNSVGSQDSSYTDDPYGGQGMINDARGRDSWFGRGDPRNGVGSQDSSYTDNPYQGLIEELLGTGSDPLAGLPGHSADDPWTSRADAMVGRGSGFHRFGWDGSFSDGGPLGFGSQLVGGGGSEGWRDVVGGGLEKGGKAIAAFGIGFADAGFKLLDNSHLDVLGYAAVAVITGTDVVFVIGTGAVIEATGKWLQPSPDPDPGPDPDDEFSGLYPDPYGGGGNPTTIWDGDGGVSPTTIWDGDGGVSPATIWDENGGVSPATIWDENGGGGAPNTIQGIPFTATVAAGPGLRAGAIQIGPRTFA